jgi:hypothetical protein
VSVFPAAERYDEYARPVATTGYADPGYDPRFEETGWDSRAYDDAQWDLHDGYAQDYDEGDDHGYDDQGYGYDDYDDGDWAGEDWGPARTNRFAIWGLVCAFLLAPLGLVLSIVGLVQAGRRQERGRVLAVLGILVALAILAFSVTVGVRAVDSVAQRLGIDLPGSSSTTDSAATGSTAAGAAAKPPGSVLEACNTLMPTLMSLDQEMSAVQTPADAAIAVGKLKTAVLAAAAAPDPAFQQHLNTLAADLQKLVDATTTGQIPPGLEKTLTTDAFAVGTDCGNAGWTG